MALSIRAVSLHVNTHGIATSRIAWCMAETKSERLRAARSRAGFSSAAEAANRFGWGEAAYRHHENGTRNFGADAARKYGRAFRVNAGWLLGWDGVAEKPASQAASSERLIVNGGVAAGVWRETEHWDDDRAFYIEGMPAPFEESKRFGLQVEGFSMNEFYEPGTVLDCVSIFEGGVAPANGDHVIVERRRPDGLRELTVKEYRDEGGRLSLVPRSTHSEFKPIDYPGPDAEHTGEEEVAVIAFVFAHYPPRVIDLFRRMGMIKKASDG